MNKLSFSDNGASQDKKISKDIYIILSDFHLEPFELRGTFENMIAAAIKPKRKKILKQTIDLQIT